MICSKMCNSFMSHMENSIGKLATKVFWGQYKTWTLDFGLTVDWNLDSIMDSIFRQEF